ncbi:hypothetical protein BC830DRAFT_1085220 [Chytriomyces sp. MP71]|nr:hypothetical protein BC830DRAFT_1085220 [Chytriomyces sp. MP71]
MAQPGPGMQQRVLVHPSFASTVHFVPGYDVIRSLGVVRGLTVRNPNVGKAMFAGFASMGGGESSVFMETAEKAREAAMQRLLEHAGAMGAETGSAGANAIIGIRYDTQEVMEGMTECLAYGTAVVIQPSQPK